MPTNTIARSIEQKCYVVPEAIKGTAVFPTVASEAIVAAGTVEINQQPTFNDSKEIFNTLDVLDRFRDQIAAGTFTIPTYFRPSGVAGTAPMAKTLLTSLFGVETVVGSASVSYTQAIEKPSFTLWVQKGHTVFFGSGCCVDKGSVNITNKGGDEISFSGGLMVMGWAGTGEVSGAVTASTTVVVTDGRVFTAGAYVQFDADTNTDAGYKIQSVLGDTLTMIDEITCADGAVIKGFLPSHTAVGAPNKTKEVSLTVGGVSTVLTSLSVEISSPAIYQNDEMTDTGYPTDYVEDTREITGSLGMLFRKDNLSFFKDGLDGTIKAIIIALGTTAGKITTINLPYASLEVPAVETNKPTVNLTANYKAIGSAGEDSCSIVFT